MIGLRKAPHPPFGHPLPEGDTYLLPWNADEITAMPNAVEAMNHRVGVGEIGRLFRQRSGGEGAAQRRMRGLAIDFGVSKDPHPPFGHPLPSGEGISE